MGHLRFSQEVADVESIVMQILAGNRQRLHETSAASPTDGFAACWHPVRGITAKELDLLHLANHWKSGRGRGRIRAARRMAPATRADAFLLSRLRGDVVNDVIRPLGI